MSKAVVKYSVRLANHRTSVSLEPAFWQAIHDIANQQHIPVRQLVEQIDHQRLHQPTTNLSSALRVYVLLFYRDKLHQTGK